MKTKKDIAKTKKDWELGILNNKTVFPFGYPGPKQMTMNTPGGTVPYPIEYIGVTNGKITDKGIANPGDDFMVNGDTVIENKINMNNKFNDIELEGEIARLKAMKKAMFKKYQEGGMVDTPAEMTQEAPVPSEEEYMEEVNELPEMNQEPVDNSADMISDLIMNKLSSGTKFSNKDLKNINSNIEKDDADLAANILNGTLDMISKSDIDFTDEESLTSFLNKTGVTTNEMIKGLFQTPVVEQEEQPVMGNQTEQNIEEEFSNDLTVDPQTNKKLPFSQAYAMASQNGMNEFVWEGSTYKTNNNMKRQNGGPVTYMGGINVGDEMGGNTAPYKYFDNTRNYKHNPTMNKFIGKALQFGQKGTTIQPQTNADVEAFRTASRSSAPVESNLTYRDRQEIKTPAKATPMQGEQMYVEPRGAYYMSPAQKARLKAIITKQIPEDQLTNEDINLYNQAVKGKTYQDGGQLNASELSFDELRARNSQIKQMQQEQDFLTNKINKYKNQGYGMAPVGYGDKLQGQLNKVMMAKDALVNQGVVLKGTPQTTRNFVPTQAPNANLSDLEQYQKASRSSQPMIQNIHYGLNPMQTRKAFEMNQAVAAHKQRMNDQFMNDPRRLERRYYGLNNQEVQDDLDRRDSRQPSMYNDNVTTPRQTGGYVDEVYPTLVDEAKAIIGKGRTYNDEWNLREVGGYGNDKYSYQTGGNMPKYVAGQTIKYKSGGKIMTGVVKSYDAKTGKIKLR